MIPGVTPVGQYAIAELPAALDASVPDPLAEFLKDPYAVRTYLLEASPYDPATASTVNVRLSNDGYATRPGDPDLPNEAFRNRLARPYNVQVSILDGGRLRQRAIPAFGDVEILNTDGELSAFCGYEWARRPVTIKVGRPSFDYAEFGTIFPGTAEAVLWDPETILLKLRDLGHKLSTPLQTRLYGGFGTCLRLDGVDDLASGTANCPAGSMTIEVRAKTSTTAAAVRCISGWQNGSAAGERLLKLLASGSNRVAFRVRNDAGANFDAIHDAMTAGLVYHLAGVLDVTAAKALLYVNGVLAQEVAVSGTFATALTAFAAGRRPDASSEFLAGDVDEIRVWAAARTGTEIVANKDRELQGNETGLVHYWKLNEGGGGAAANSVAAGPSLTITGATWIGSLEGSVDVAGKPKPKIWGQVRSFEPVLVDGLSLIYQIHDGALQAIDGLFDRGVALASAGDVADLHATTVSAGQYKTCLAKGLIRLGVKPDGVLTVDARGDSTGGYVSSAADIVKRIVKNQGGLTDAELDLGSFAAVNTTNSAVHGYAARLEQVSIDDAISELMGSVGGYWTYTRAGVLRVGVLTTPGTPLSTLGEADVVLGGVSREAAAPPTKRYTLGYRRNWTTLDPSAAGSTLSAEQKSLLAQHVRQVTAETTSATLATEHLDAEDAVAETLMDTEAAARTEAQRRQALWGRKPWVYRVPLVAGLFTYEIGDSLRLQLPLFDLASGRDFVVVGFTEDVAGDDISLLLLGWT